MSTPTPQARRATIDDVAQLAPLWQQEHLPAAALERRFKEFVILEENGQIVAAIGFQVEGQEGLLHSEALSRFDQADAWRGLLWERVQTIARNYGLVRIWTQLTMPFWRSNGFQPASSEVLGRKPASFQGDERPWMALQLRDEALTAVSLDKEFAMFREAEKERTERLFRQARVLKFLALVIAVAVLALVILWAVLFFRQQAQTPRL